MINVESLEFVSFYFSCVFCLFLLFSFRAPERKVITEKLHDQCRVFVGCVRELIKLFDCSVERFLSELASFFWLLQDLIVAYRKVESQTKLSRMRLWER